MAFGSSGDQEITLKVFLDLAQASGDAERFFDEFKKGIAEGVAAEAKLSDGLKKLGSNGKQAASDISSAFDKLRTSAQSPSTSIKELGKLFIDANPAIKNAAVSLAEFVTVNSKLLTIIGGVITGVTTLTIGFNKLISIAGDGDKFGDVSDAFQDNADKAGILADELLNNLSRAFLGTADSATLMTEANKAFALGIDPGVFDDLALAAKRYAEATGGDATQALDELILGVNSGREALLRKFGTIEDGLLVLKEFTDAEFQNGLATVNVTDIYEQFQVTVKDAYNEFAKAVNNSDALKLATSALTGVLGALAQGLSKVGQGVLSVADFFARQLQTAIDGVLAGFTYLSSVIGDLSTGNIPDFSKAFDAAAKRIAGYQKQAESAGKVTVKLGGSAKESGKVIAQSTKDSVGEAVDALTQFEKDVNDILGLEDFRLSPQIKEMRDKVREAFTFGNGDKQIISDAIKKNVTDPYTQALIGKPEEFQKKLGEIKDAIAKVNSEQSQKASTKVDPTSTIFGIDAGDISQDLASSIEGALSTALSLVSKSITSGVTSQDAGAVGTALGTVIGTAVGAYFGSPEAGALAGSALGGFLGQIAAQFGEDSAGTKARKEADKFFADVFSADRLSVVINGELTRINDLVFNRNTGGNGGLFGGVATALGGFVTGGATAALSGFGSSPSPDQTNQDFFATLPQSAQSAFNAVGLAFEQFLGVAEDYGGQLAAVFAGNIGGSLQNLQVLVQATGRSFEDLGDAIIQSFLNGNLTIQEAYDSLAQLSDLFQAGIPGQIGAIDQAFRNFDAALQDGRGSRFLIDSLRDIGAEAQELGIKDFPTLANQLVQAFGFAGPQIDAFFAALKASGINSITDLVNASSAALIGLARNVQLIQQGAAPTATTITDPTAGTTAPGNFTAGGVSRSFSAGGASSGRSAAQNARDRAASDRKRQLQGLQQETIKLVTASSSYSRIIDELNKKLISSKSAGEDISELYKKQFKVLQDVQKAQDAYNKALANGASGKKLGDLAKNLEKAQAAADKLNQKIGDNGRVDLSGLTKYITSLNQLGVVSKAVGVNADTLVNTLVQGFLRGKLSISQVNDEIAKVKDLLGDGIPGAVGAVDQAFSNLVKGGRNGGLFSVDAFKDVFAEFDELFAKSFGAERQKQLQQLTTEFNNARDALQGGIAGGKAPAEIKELRDQFEGAQKALQDFNETIPKADFEDLRAELQRTFSGDQVDTFFKALQQSGVNTFDEFKNASSELVIGILGNLDKLGFDFAAQTDESTAKLIEQFNTLNNAQTQNKDVLQEQLNLINQFTSGLGAPFEKLSDDFGGVIDKLALFDNKQYSSDIILNVDFNAKNSATQSLIDLLFGSGGGSTVDTGGEGPGLRTGLTTAEKREFFALRRKRKTGKLSAADQRRFDELNSKRGG